MKAHPRLATTAGAALLVTVAVALVYRQATFAYFLEDDFHWLAGARRFEWGHLVQLDRYDHFYRPVIEIYFFLGHQLAGCAPLPFHLASIGIHLLNTGVLFLLARQIAGSVLFASLAVVLFVVQPGYAEAVAWVAAITDLLPASWFLLTLLLHVVFLRTGRWWAYGAAMATFAACLLTHETAATLLPMMIALQTLLFLEGAPAKTGARPAAWLARYAPFAGMLLPFLVVAYVVNSRSCLVRDEYYAFGPHAFRNALHYLVALYVGKRSVVDYVLVVAGIGAVLVRGTHRMHFWVVWIGVTLLPCLFFTWGIASRYLYVPAAGFALLLADLLCAFTTAAAATRRLPLGALRRVRGPGRGRLHGADAAISAPGDRDRREQSRVARRRHGVCGAAARGGRARDLPGPGRRDRAVRNRRAAGAPVRQGRLAGRVPAGRRLSRFGGPA